MDKRHTLFDIWLDIERIKLLPEPREDVERVWTIFIQDGATRFLSIPSELKGTMSGFMDNKLPKLSFHFFCTLQHFLEEELLPLYQAFEESNEFVSYHGTSTTKLERNEYTIMLECLFYTKERLSYDPTRMRSMEETIGKYQENNQVELNLSNHSEITLAKNIEVICDILKTKNGKLKVLHLAKTDITDKELILLARTLETNKTLEILDLSYNKISDIGVTHLIFMLRENKTNALKSIYLHGNPLISKNSELLIWNFIASKHLPTALDMMGTKESLQKQQILKMKKLRANLLLLLSDLEVYEHKSIIQRNRNRKTEQEITTAVEEFHNQKPQENLELLDQLNDHSFSCEFNSLGGRFEWIWKDSVTRNWKQALEDFALVHALPTHKNIQRPLVYFETSKLVGAVFSPTGETLKSIITKRNRKQFLKIQETGWAEYASGIVLSILIALKALHQHHVYYHTISPSSISLLTKYKNPEIRLHCSYDAKNCIAEEDEQFMAPEIVAGAPPDEKSIVFPVGVIVLILFSRIDVPDQFSSVIQRCLIKDPTERPTLEDIEIASFELVAWLSK